MNLKESRKTQLLQYGQTKGSSGFGQAESRSGLYSVRVDPLGILAWLPVICTYLADTNMYLYLLLDDLG